MFASTTAGMEKLAFVLNLLYKQMHRTTGSDVKMNTTDCLQWYISCKVIHT